MSLFRQRKTHFPRTYFLYRNKHRYFLLFWLEFSSDGSVYVWIDDNPNNSWMLVAKHSQTIPIRGKTTIGLERKQYELYDPHISWHASGKIHISGYDNKGKKGKVIISDKRTYSQEDVKKGKNVPYTQLIFPTVNYKNTLMFFWKSLPKEIEESKYIGILSKKGFRVINEKSENESYYIIDNSLLKSNKNLGIDLCIHDKNIEVEPIGDLNSYLLYPYMMNVFKEKTSNAVGVRLFYAGVEYEHTLVDTIVATCFNLASVDLIQLIKI